MVGEAEVRSIGALPSARGTITRLAYAKSKAAGLDANLLLKKAGLTIQQIDDQTARINVGNQIGFLNLVGVALKDDILGFHLALPAELREMGLLYYVAASSETLGEALQRLARYGSIVNEGVCLKLLDDGDIGINFYYVGVSRHLDRHQIEFFATALLRVCRTLTGRRLMPSRVRFAHHRDAAGADFCEFFGDKIQFGAGADEVAFAKGTKDVPVVSADPYLNKLLIAYCEEALSRRPVTLGSFRAIVENAILPLLPHGKAQSAEIARRLGMSARTFARRLTAEGVTFSEVLDSLKSHLAERYLADEALSISQIAWLLGYREVSAFTHAFRRWTGKTPRQARTHKQG